MTAPRRLALAVYVCADPGIPVFGTKGSSIHVQAVLGELHRRAAETHLITVRRGGEPGAALAGVEVHELEAPGGEPAEREAALVQIDEAIAACLGRIVGIRRPDVVYQRYSLWSCAPTELAARRGWPSVLEINAPLVDEQTRHRRLVDRTTAEDRTVRAISAATLPVAVTTDVALWAERLTGRCPIVVPNGVDAARFTATGGARGRDGDRLTIGFVGTYKPWHDLDAIVTTVEHLGTMAGVPPVSLLLVGDGPELPRLRARLDALALDVSVEVVGTVAPERIPELLARVDVAVAPYGADEQYFSPLKVFEYLAAGVAVVASRIGGLDGCLLDEREALLVAPGDRHGFARAVGRLCTDPVARRALGEAGRSAAVLRFGWHRAVDRILTDLAHRPAA